MLYVLLFLILDVEPGFPYKIADRLLDPDFRAFIGNNYLLNMLTTHEKAHYLTKDCLGLFFVFSCVLLGDNYMCGVCGARRCIDENYSGGKESYWN